MVFMDNLLIRVDGSYEIGIGHFMRSLALAQMWLKDRGNVYFLINNNEYLKDRVKKEGMDYIIHYNKSGSIDDANFLIKEVKKLNISWVIVDGYVFKEEYFNLIRNANIRYLIFDDKGELSYYNSNIILNQNLHGKKEYYDLKKENYTKLLIGTKFTLLRNEFLKYINYKKNIKDKANNVLITLGGSDIKNYSLKILKILINIDISDLEVIVLVGANNPHFNELQNYVNNINANVKLLKSVLDMPEIMKWADLAFSSGGSTVWELAFMGVPTIVGATSKAEEFLIKGLNDNNLFKTVGKLDNLNEKILENLFKEIIYSKKQREIMSQDGQIFVDGYGSKRVIDCMRK